MLLQKYNISSIDPVEEGKKLELLEEEYSTLSYQVNTNTMLEAAMELRSEQKKMALIRIDSEIYELSNELSKLETLMNESQQRDVPYLLELDTLYRTAIGEMESKQQERTAWTEQKRK